ncbi:uncharacterized protein A4U43_C04F14480 [Asparagus officinalis]|uniref:Uncharacterized protein n=1 Tax=Asparagus officinalis TaxID=4686 RepID=A0A5P1F3J5_ASPOF|nr:uncharacterized protein A4U43_C04F14480 [Asparagus officinalis]
MVDRLKVSDGQKAVEIDKLKHKLHEQNKSMEFLSKQVSDYVDDEAVKDSAEEAGEDLSKDSWASLLGKKASEGGESKVQSTSLPPPTDTSLPLTPGEGVDPP